jgi:hypothetical protein
VEQDRQACLLAAWDCTTRQPGEETHYRSQGGLVGHNPDCIAAALDRKKGAGSLRQPDKCAAALPTSSSAGAREEPQIRLAFL